MSACKSSRSSSSAALDGRTAAIVTTDAPTCALKRLKSRGSPLEPASAATARLAMEESAPRRSAKNRLGREGFMALIPIRSLVSISPSHSQHQKAVRTVPTHIRNCRIVGRNRAVAPAASVLPIVRGRVSYQQLYLISLQQRADAS